ncbi:hypothetical protein ACOMHN_016055 [Nucella lapillus]
MGHGTPGHGAQYELHLGMGHSTPGHGAQYTRAWGTAHTHTSLTHRGQNFVVSSLEEKQNWNCEQELFFGLDFICVRFLCSDTSAVGGHDTSFVFVFCVQTQVLSAGVVLLVLSLAAVYILNSRADVLFSHRGVMRDYLFHVDS